MSSLVSMREGRSSLVREGRALLVALDLVFEGVDVAAI